MDPLLDFVLYVIIVGVLAWLLIVLLQYVGRLLGAAEPLFKVGRVLIIVIAVVLIVRRAWPLLGSI